MDALLGRASSRFLFVTVLPSAVLVAFVSALLAAGAPRTAPSWSAALDALQDMSARDALGLAFLVIVASVALHPLQTPLIQLLEGYWSVLPMGETLHDLAVQRHARTWQELRALVNDESAEVSYRTLSAAEFTLHWMPDDDDKLLPTSLGNTLRAGEERAGARYGFSIAVLIPRLLPLLDADQRDRLADGRTQLDAAARMCAVSLMCVAVSLVLLLPVASWLYLPLVMLILAWMAYRSAIAAARTYCTQMAAIVDLHHLEVWRALSLPTPMNLQQERTSAAPLSGFLAGHVPDDEYAEQLKWVRNTSDRNQP